MAEEPENIASTSTEAAVNSSSSSSSSSASPTTQQNIFSQDSQKQQAQTPAFCGVPTQNGDIQMFPYMYPVLVPGPFPVQQEQDQMNGGPGLYAVPMLPFVGHMTGFPTNTLIPFTYNLPTGRSSQETGAVGGEQGQSGEQQQQQPPAHQRQVHVRRFQIAFQVDILLILKLAAVIFLFNQDGSRQRLALLVFFASLVYLYQTGALAPLVRWLSQGMQRAAPPQPPRPAARADNAPGDGRQGNENAVGAEGQPAGENENQPLLDGNRAVENAQVMEPQGGEAGNRWWGIVKEIQMFVFGFITSLLPGFHNLD